MKFRNVVYKLSSGGARQILRLISTGGRGMGSKQHMGVSKATRRHRSSG